MSKRTPIKKTNDFFMSTLGGNSARNYNVESAKKKRSGSSESLQATMLALRTAKNQDDISERGSILSSFNSFASAAGVNKSVTSFV